MNGFNDADIAKSQVIVNENNVLQQVLRTKKEEMRNYQRQLEATEQEMEGLHRL